MEGSGGLVGLEGNQMSYDKQQEQLAPSPELTSRDWKKNLRYQTSKMRFTNNRLTNLQIFKCIF